MKSIILSMLFVHEAHKWIVDRTSGFWRGRGQYRMYRQSKHTHCCCLGMSICLGAGAYYPHYDVSLPMDLEPLRRGDRYVCCSLLIVRSGGVGEIGLGGMDS